MEVTKIIRKLAETPNERVIVESVLGSGPSWAKLPKGTNALQYKTTLYYLLHDLAIDLKVDFDRDILRTELGLT